MPPLPGGRERVRRGAAGASLGIAFLLVFGAGRANAQRVNAPRFVDRGSVISLSETPSPTAGARDSAAATVRPTSWAILASAVLPGAGQAILRQRRALVYVAIEAFALSSYNGHTRVARRTRDEYRALASNVARAAFSALRPVGDFDYYERMQHFASSGVFDLGAGGGLLQPERDTTTFNGAMWLLARRTYWKDPFQSPERGTAEWTKAEQFYVQRAIRPEFRWSWEGADGEYSLFRQLIRRSNDRYRSAVADLGVVLGNHVLSAIDASVALRLAQRRTALGRTYEVSIDVPLAIGR